MTPRGHSPAPGSPRNLAAWSFKRPNFRRSLHAWFALRHVAVLLLVILASATTSLKPIGVSPDAENYRNTFEWAVRADWGELLSGNDPLFHAASKFFWQVGIEFTGFMFVVALVTCAAKVAVVRALDTERTVLLVLYFSYLFWLHEYTQVRLALGISLAMLAIYKKSRFSWLLFALAASLHISTVLIIALHLAVRHRKVALAAAGAVLALPMLSGSAEELLVGVVARVTIYFDLLDAGEFTEINIFSLMPLLQSAILLVSIRHLRKIQAHGSEEFVFACCGAAAFYLLSSVPVLAFRIYELFIPFFVIFISRVWRHAIWVRVLCLLYFLLGLRTTFFGDGSLLFALGG